MNWLLTIVLFIVMLSVLVVIHEAGHFFSARAFGVRVTEFMVGLPGPSIGFTHKETRFGLTAIPLGGYARICGMEAGEEDPLLPDALAYVYRHGSSDAEHLAAALDIDEEYADNLLIILSGWGSITTPKGTLTADTYLACPRGPYAKGEARDVDDPVALIDEERKGTYRALSFWKRLVCLFAGPFMNVLFAFLIFLLLFCAHGVYEPTNLIAQTVDGSPAQAAGIEAGDRIVAIDDVQTPDWDSLGQAIDSYSPGDEATVTYVRDGQTEQTTISFSSDDSGSTIIGIYADYELNRMSVGEACAESFSYLGQVAEAVGKLLVPTQAAQTLQESSSVVGIAYMTKDAISSGFLTFVLLSAMLSVSLGFMNLLPIPPLDGGRIIIEIVQRIVHHDLSTRAYNILTIIGIALVMALFVFLLAQDIGRYVIGG